MNMMVQREMHTNHKEQMVERAIAQWLKLHEREPEQASKTHLQQRH